MKAVFHKASFASAEPIDDGNALPEQQQDRMIGDLIGKDNRLSPDQIEQILEHQRTNGVRFGEAAVSLGMVSNDDVLWALSKQFDYPYAEESGGAVNPELVVAHSPFGPQAEAFRDLRSQLLMGVLSPDQPPRALAIVSPNSGDGKSFFSANMAIALSQIGGRTLLVDADMRTPRQHSMFGVDNSAGLSSILSGRAEQSIIQQVAGLPSLYILPVGSVPPNPLELVQRPAFNLLLNELLRKFDHVVVDTPAMVHGSDARVVCSKCGAALAIGRQDKTRLPDMQGLIDAIGKTGAKLAGVVLNEF